MATLRLLTFLLMGALTVAWPDHGKPAPTPGLSSPQPPAQKMRGLNLVAPPNPFSDNPMPAVQAVGADWVAIIPFAYTRPGDPSVHFGSPWQWWGERPEGAEATVKLAKEHGLQVMLKPQVYVPGSWPGGLDFSADEWKAWETSYEAYLLPLVDMAQKEKVDLICIGTEFKLSSTTRPDFWRQLIRKVRARYDGRLTYAANWDEYRHIEFWNELDFIGVDAYFPLVDSHTPSVPELRKAWKPILQQLSAVQRAVGKPLLFTEYGYLSVDGCASKTWELESRIARLAVNEQAQANALEALLATFWPEANWAGGFLWKWFPNMQGHEGYPGKDYSPQGKIAEGVLKNWYGSRTY